MISDVADSRSHHNLVLQLLKTFKVSDISLLVPVGLEDIVGFSYKNVFIVSHFFAQSLRCKENRKRSSNFFLIKLRYMLLESTARAFRSDFLLALARNLNARSGMTNPSTYECRIMQAISATTEKANPDQKMQINSSPRSEKGYNSMWLQSVRGRWHSQFFSWATEISLYIPSDNQNAHAFLEVFWAFEDLEALMDQYLKERRSKAKDLMQNVLALQNAFCDHEPNKSLSECLKWQNVTGVSAETTWEPHELHVRRPFAQRFLKYATRNVLALEVSRSWTFEWSALKFNSCSDRLNLSELVTHSVQLP